MIIEELWTREDDSDIAAFRAATAVGDLAGALLAVEGVRGPVADADRFLLAEWGRRVAPRAEHASPEGQARILAAVLGGELGFRGDESGGYQHPRNSHLHEVLHRRRGLPILLSSIWIEVGRRAGITLEGIGLPGHFIARVGGEGGVLVDPFGGGRILTPEECRRAVENLAEGRVGWQDEFLQPSALPELLERVLRNLLNAHGRERDGRGLYRDASFLCALRPDQPSALLQRASIAGNLGAVREAERDLAELLRRFPASREAEVVAQRRRQRPKGGPLPN